MLSYQKITTNFVQRAVSGLLSRIAIVLSVMNARRKTVEYIGIVKYAKDVSNNHGSIVNAVKSAHWQTITVWVVLDPNSSSK